MGFLNNMIESARQNLETSRENAQRQAQIQAECNQDRSIGLNITFGNRELGINPVCVLRQKTDGSCYFDFNRISFYRFIEYEWNGPEYDNVLTAQTAGTQNTETIKKGKSGKMAAGAVIGTILFPVVGTAVGAAIGAGGKSKTNASTVQQSNTVQVSKQVEKNTTAVLKFQRIGDNAIFPVTVVCGTAFDSQIKCFNIEKQLTTSEISKTANDALKGIKALKELLDMGAITQEEFDAKKNQLLNS